MKLLPFTLWLLFFPAVCWFCNDLAFSWYGKPDDGCLIILLLVEAVIYFTIAVELHSEGKER